MISSATASEGASSSPPSGGGMISSARGAQSSAAAARDVASAGAGALWGSAALPKSTASDVSVGLAGVSAGARRPPPSMIFGSDAIASVCTSSGRCGQSSSSGASAAGAASMASPPAGGAAPGRRAGAVSTAADVANAAAKTTRNAWRRCRGIQGDCSRAGASTGPSW